MPGVGYEEQGGCQSSSELLEGVTSHWVEVSGGFAGESSIVALDVAYSQRVEPVSFDLSTQDRLMLAGRSFWFYFQKLAWPSSFLSSRSRPASFMKRLTMATERK